MGWGIKGELAGDTIKNVLAGFIKEYSLYLDSLGWVGDEQAALTISVTFLFTYSLSSLLSSAVSS